MKKLRIIAIFAAVLTLFGCSQKPETNTQAATTANVANSEIKIEADVTEAATAQKNQDTTTANKPVKESQTEGKIQAETQTSIYATRPKETAATTVKNTPSDSELYDLYGSGNRLGYRKKGNLYYVDDIEAAESEKGYSSDAYRTVNDYGTSLKQITVSFTYGENEWRIISCKGVYGYRFAGSDTVISTLPKGNSFNDDILYSRYSIPSEENLLKIQIDAYESDGTPMFSTDYAEHWWANGFIESDMQNADEMYSKTRITLKDAEMTTLFTAGLDKQGFKAVESEQDLKLNCYFVSGNDVWYVF